MQLLDIEQLSDVLQDSLAQHVLGHLGDHEGKALASFVFAPVYVVIHDACAMVHIHVLLGKDHEMMDLVLCDSPSIAHQLGIDIDFGIYIHMLLWGDFLDGIGGRSRCRK
jgi:hypothetical protein